MLYNARARCLSLYSAGRFRTYTIMSLSSPAATRSHNPRNPDRRRSGSWPLGSPPRAPARGSHPPLATGSGPRRRGPSPCRSSSDSLYQPSTYVCTLYRARSQCEHMSSKVPTSHRRLGRRPSRSARFRLAAASRSRISAGTGWSRQTLQSHAASAIVIDCACRACEGTRAPGAEEHGDNAAVGSAR